MGWNPHWKLGTWLRWPYRSHRKKWGLRKVYLFVGHEGSTSLQLGRPPGCLEAPAWKVSEITCFFFSFFFWFLQIPCWVVVSFFWEIFTPILGEKIPNLTGWEKPPTSLFACLSATRENIDHSSGQIIATENTSFHPKWWLSKGNLPISLETYRWVKYCIIPLGQIHGEIPFQSPFFWKNLIQLEGLSTSGCGLVTSDTWWFSTAASGWCTLGRWHLFGGGMGMGKTFWGVEGFFCKVGRGSCGPVWWVLDPGRTRCLNKRPKGTSLEKVPNGKMDEDGDFSGKTTESRVREFEKNPGMYDRHLYM